VNRQVCGNVNIKEGKVTDPFGLHSELNILMYTVQVVKEVRQLAWIMRPDNEHVIHVTKPTGGGL
jgi:hypothetical protein